MRIANIRFADGISLSFKTYRYNNIIDKRLDMEFKDENPIISEDYADLLIETNKIEKISQDFPQATIYSINYFLSLVNIPVDDITNNTIKDLGYSVFPAILGLTSEESLAHSGIQRLRDIPNYNLRGQGVLIAIIDTGIDYTNPIFRYADGTTRIVTIWDQTIQSGNSPDGFFYGTEYTREQINRALQSENPYNIVPTKDEIGHGTMVAGIAGGRAVPESDFYGVAPEAEFIVVKLKPIKKYLKKIFCIPENAIGYQENDITFALSYILNRISICKRPVVICLAIDTSEGAHDGRGIFSNYLSYIATLPGIVVVAGTGNEGNAKRHYFSTINKDVPSNTVELYVGQNEDFIMQLWGNVSIMFAIDIIAPSGERIMNITPITDEYREIAFTSLDTIIYLDYQMVEPQSGIQLVFFRFIKPVSGSWQFIITTISDMELSFHIWLPMSGFISDNTYFIHPDPYTTILAIATIAPILKATAYNTEDGSLFQNAGRGYSRIGVITPDIAVPGVNIIGPTIDSSFAAFTGSSVAASFMAGAVALLLEWGIVKGNYSNLSTVEIKNLVSIGARRDPDIIYPNPDWGYGILDMYNIFSTLL